MNLILTNLFLVVFVALAAALPHDKHFRCDYEYYASIGGWVKLHKIPLDWENAREMCQFEGGLLASPINEELKVVLTYLMGSGKELKFNNIFTGIHSSYSLEGVSLYNMPHEWANIEFESNRNGGNCISMGSDGKLAYASCNERLPYICYKKFTRDLTINECGTTDKDYSMDLSTGSCYKFHVQARTWPNARKVCEAEGGYLAIINNYNEAGVIETIYGQYPSESIIGATYNGKAFIGYKGWHQNSDFVTIDGQTLQQAGYAYFAPGEPDLGENLVPYCGAVMRDGTLYVIKCQSKMAFICEKSPDSLLCNKST